MIEHRSSEFLAREMVETWHTKDRNFFVIVPPLNDSAQLFLRLREPGAFLTERSGTADFLAIAWCPHGTFSDPEELATSACDAWGCEKKSERSYQRWLNDAVATVVRRGQKPILLLPSFHRIVLRLPEELGSCLRDLNQHGGLICVAEVPLDWPVLLERWRNEGRGGLIHSEFGQGYRKLLLHGYERKEVESQLSTGGIDPGWAKPILEVTGGFQRWVEHLVDAVGGKTPRKQWEDALLESSEFSNFLEYLDASGSQAHGRALAAMFHGVADVNDRNAINGHPWRDFLVNDDGSLRSSAIGLGCARRCGLHPARSLEHTARQLLRFGAYSECEHMLERVGEAKRSLQREWLIARIMGKSQSGTDEWNTVLQDLRSLELLSAVGENGAQACVILWRGFAEKMLDFSKRKTSANPDPIGHLCGRYGDKADPHTALQLVELRLDWAERIASPLLATHAILAIPEALLQLYAAIVLDLRYWEPPTLDEVALESIRALPKRGDFEWPKEPGPLSVGQLLALSWVKMQAIPATKRLVADVAGLDRLQQLHTQDRNLLAHRLTFSSRPQWKRYAKESRELFAAVTRILLQPETPEALRLPSLLRLLEPDAPSVGLVPEAAAIPDRPTAFAQAQSIFVLATLHECRRLAGGLSGAGVFLVEYAEAADGKMRLGILKIPSTREAFVDEHRGAKLATAEGCWLKQHVPTDQRFEERDAQTFILSRLAFPATNERGIRSLHDLLVDGERERALGVARRLGQIYAGQLSRARIVSGTPHQLFSEIWKPWREPALRIDWKEELGLPEREELRFSDGETIWSNPLASLEDRTVWGDMGSMHLRWGWQHRDLNARNVLVAPAGTADIRLIDLEKITESSAVLDLCWVSFWALIAGAERGASPNDRSWALLPEAFIAATLGVLAPSVRPSQPDLGIFQLSLDFVRELFLVLVQQQQVVEDPVLLKDMVAITLASSSLAKCFYEVKYVHERKAKDVRMARERGRCFFRIAARAVKPFTQLRLSEIKTELSAPFEG